jgi:hypothetical protein
MRRERRNHHRCQQSAGVNSIIGTGAIATGSVAVGFASSAANGGAAFDDNTVATGTNSAALDMGASATHANSVAIGNGATTTRDNQEAQTPRFSIAPSSVWVARRVARRRWRLLGAEAS